MSVGTNRWGFKLFVMQMSVRSNRWGFKLFVAQMSVRTNRWGLFSVPVDNFFDFYNAWQTEIKQTKTLDVLSVQYEAMQQVLVFIFIHDEFKSFYLIWYIFVFYWICLCVQWIPLFYFLLVTIFRQCFLYYIFFRTVLQNFADCRSF